ncbi:MAG: hypothetical protein AseanaTS_06890 [Candidatus Pelagadaptatus aseana]|uniref:MBL fold metallo-hydrolase n=1 Tax=Candidatus Pelagadaptatus aseana TaxID=3120508 RepID=UPI0039B2505C
MTLKLKLIAIATIASLLLLVGFIFYPSSAGMRQQGNLNIATFSKDFTNVHLVSFEGKHLLIDAGLGKHQQALESFLASSGVKAKDLSALIVTHGHHDHAGTAAYFQKKHGVKIIGGKADLSYFSTGKNGTLCPTSLMARARHNMDQKGTFEKFEPDILVENQLDISNLIGTPAKITNVPGHTPGSLVITLGGVAFVGDLLRGGLINQSVAAMHFYQCNFPALKQGTQTLLTELAPQAATFFPSHLGPVTRSSVENLLQVIPE